MKVYKLELEVDDYQSLLPKDDSVFDTGLLSLDGSSKKGQWVSPLEVELDNNEALVPDIYSLGAGNFLISAAFINILKHKLVNTEFLPVFWSEGERCLINVVGYSDCLDADSTEWCLDDDSGRRLFIEEHQFNKSKLPESFLFKIEEECFELFCVDKEDGSENFKFLIEKHDLKGVGFEVVWEC